MPTYEYICAKCGHAFERVQSMAEAALTVCPKDACPRKRWGKGKVQRAISGGAGLIFKGSGFYITDYRSESYKEAARKDTAPAVSSTEKSGAKPSETPAKKAAPAPSKPTPAPSS